MDLPTDIYVVMGMSLQDRIPYVDSVTDNLKQAMELVMDWTENVEAGYEPIHVFWVQRTFMRTKHDAESKYDDE